MPSGVMAQSIALMIHSKTHRMKNKINNDDTKNKDKKRYQVRFACHHTSHLLLWEEDSYKELLDMDVVEISTKYDHDLNDVHRDSISIIHVPPMGYQDVYNAFTKEKEHYLMSHNDDDDDDDNNGIISNLGQSGLSTLIIELPHRELGGKRTPWDDILRIQKLCKEEGVKFHCDGARIFEASAGYG